MSRFAVLSSCGEPWGGSEELWFEAACALRADGHDVSVWKTNVDAAEPRIAQLRRAGCAVRDLNRSGPGAFWYALTSPTFARLSVPLHLALNGPRVRMARPDLAIVSQGGNFDGVNFARVCERLRIPYVLVSQKATGLHWPSDVARELIRETHERARRTVFVSHHNLELTRRQLDADLPRAVVLDNPVLAGRAGPLPWPAGDGPLRLACVGRLFVLEKAQELLLEALARPRWRERDVELSVYGRGIHREGLEGMARRLGLANVSFHGHVADIAAVWRSHHALVLASRAEGLPLVVGEAMACGRVPIVTDAGGTAELVQDGVTGFVAQPGSADAIDAALERAWARRGELGEMGARAAARVAELLRARGPAPLARVALEALAAGQRRG